MKLLKPLAVVGKRRDPIRLATFDIESHNWTDYAYGAHFDGQDIRFFDSARDLTLFMLSDRFRDWLQFAHYGGKFDFLFLLDTLRDTGHPIKLVETGSKVAQIEIRKRYDRGHSWKFRDSSCQLNNSLEKIAKSYATTQKLSGAIDFDGGERFEKTNTLHIQYLKNDVTSLYEVMKNYSEIPEIQAGGMKLTLAAQSMDVFRRMMDEPLIVTPQDVQDFCREGYFGGRCELFRKESPKLNVYDVNSMYPYCMRTKNLPMEYQGPATSHRDFGFHRVRVSVPTDMHIPLLHTKIDNKLYFPVGDFEGVYFSEEILLAERLGCKIEFVEGHSFTRSDKFFAKYIDHFWAQRLNSPKGSAQNETAKLFLNSLYGKFGQREERTTVKTLEDETDWVPFLDDDDIFERTGLIKITKKHRSPFMLVHIAAAITAYSRMHLYKYLIQADSEAYYCDTDSIFTTHYFNESSELGGVKLERENVRFHGRGAKFYLIEHDGHVIKKAKGFPGKFINGAEYYNKDASESAKIKYPGLSENEFTSGQMNFQDIKINGFRMNLIRNGDFLGKSAQKKSVKNDYTKRKFTKNGETRPWVVKNNRLY